MRPVAAGRTLARVPDATPIDRTAARAEGAVPGGGVPWVASMRWLRRALAAWLLRLRAGALTRRGRRALERGQVLEAIGALQLALKARPGSFPALLLLSRAYLRCHDLFRARSALAQARETDRSRFEASASAAVALEGYDLAGLNAAPAGAPARAAAVGTAEQRRPGAAPRPRAPLPLGDCRDLDEYARFRAMPPVAPGEITDWDAALSDLLDE